MLATRLSGLLAVIALLAGVLVVAPPSAPPARADDEATLDAWGRATWASFVAMTDDDSGLPTDALQVDGTRAVQTSTTNIGAYLWSAVTAERLGWIDRAELVDRVSTTLTTLEGMETYADTGQFYNWYDHRNGDKLEVWPSSGEPIVPHLSSVDNGWLATGLRVVRNAVPEVADQAGTIYDSLDFGFFYQEDVNRILFHYAPSTGDSPCCYDTIVSESRIASYIGIAEDQIPERHYFGAWRTFPDSCDWSWQEQRPYGTTMEYVGVPVFEGAYPYTSIDDGDTRVVPGWGGSAFEDLMPTLFVPEDDWGAGSWRINHPVTVQAQQYHGLVEADYGYWGFSPANIPEGGYREYGVDAVGMNPTGYSSDNANTLTDPGFAGCRDGTDVPPPSAYDGGVVTPHAAFLALRFAPEATVDNLSRLEADFPDLVTEWGFRDTVNVDTGTISDAYLSLDQGIILGAIGNALGDDVLREAFVGDDQLEARLRPLLGIEEFGAEPRGCTITGTAGRDRLTGTPGDDVICALGGDDLVDGGGGDDILYGDAGRDRLDGGAGDDVLYGDAGDDFLWGQTGDDVLSAGDGDDRLWGSRGTDRAEGGRGTDTCRADRSTGCERGTGDDVSGTGPS